MRTINPRVLIAAAIVVASIGVLAANAAETRDAHRFFELNIGDLRTELAEARAARKKGLLIVFEQKGCPGCEHMRNAVLNRSAVQDFYRANFVSLALDVWSSVPVRDFAHVERTEKDYARYLKVKGTPTFVFFDLQGREVVRHLGPLETPDEFLLLGRFVATGAYTTRSFAKYKLEQPDRKGS